MPVLLPRTVIRTISNTHLKWMTPGFVVLMGHTVSQLLTVAREEHAHTVQCACRYRAHVHSREQLPELLPPQKLILLRPLADDDPTEPAGISAGPLGPPLAAISQGSGGTGVSDELSSTKQGPTSPVTAGSAGSYGHAGDSQRPLPDAASPHVPLGQGQGIESSPDAESRRMEAVGGRGEQWDAVYLEPRELMEEGILLSANWRKHHGGPHILAAMESALASCSA